jgi:arginyl-tRNA synthetase
MLAAEFGDRYVAAPEAEWLPLFRERAVAAMLDMIRDDLALLGIRHDLFSSEAQVQAEGKVMAALDRLRAEGLVYEGVLEAPKGELPDDWEPVEMTLFRATAFGDDSDRPVRKATGSSPISATTWPITRRRRRPPTSWSTSGAPTMPARSSACRRGEGAHRRPRAARRQADPDGAAAARWRAVKMSKRSGSFVTLAEVVQEVGKDVVRFTMLTRRADAQMDFDFAKVVEASKENPVFYVQYAHARVRSLHRKAIEAGSTSGARPLDLLDDEELGLVKLAAQFPRIVEAAATTREPHRSPFICRTWRRFHASVEPRER